MYKHNDLANKRFGRLVVVAEKGRSKDRHILWECVCDCGNKIILPSNALVGNHTLSCGCLQKERTSISRKKHGGIGNRKNVERLYRVWLSMRSRCNNPNNKSYKYYGGKGIKVCEEWDDYANFRKWALQNGYDKTAKHGDCTIDRINPYQDYCPQNCRWVSMKEQNCNRRSDYLTRKMESEDT